jgi:uncharacterized membrane protein
LAFATRGRPRQKTFATCGSTSRIDRSDDMQVLFILFASLVVYRTMGALGVALFADWVSASRAALSTMLAFTGAAHFTSTRRDLIGMVPPALPRPDLLVTFTGVAELAAAVLLLMSATRTMAAYGLILLFVAMVPANISAARRQLTLRGRPATVLWLRLPMQLLFIAWAWMVR